MIPRGDVRTVGFVGLGRMGRPMAMRLAAAGYEVRATDLDPAARFALAEVPGISAVADAGSVGPVDVVILMLPSSDAVEQAVLAPGGLLEHGAAPVVIDMGSSEPRRTRALGERCAGAGTLLLDAPVSGGVAGAEAGSLTVMVGGPAPEVERLRPLFEVLGGRVLHTGDLGAGHAVKALNNLLSASHLLASSEALLAAKELGLDVERVLELINGSSGRSGSTEAKWPTFVLTERYDSGFSAELMVKDLRIAVDVLHETGTPAHLGEATLARWTAAAGELPAGADHTLIARWLEGQRVPPEDADGVDGTH